MAQIWRPADPDVLRAGAPHERGPERAGETRRRLRPGAPRRASPLPRQPRAVLHLRGLLLRPRRRAAGHPAENAARGGLALDSRGLSFARGELRQDGGSWTHAGPAAGRSPQPDQHRHRRLCDRQVDLPRHRARRNAVYLSAFTRLLARTRIRFWRRRSPARNLCAISAVTGPCYRGECQVDQRPPSQSPTRDLPMAASTQGWFRRAILAFAALLGLQATWILVAELTRPALPAFAPDAEAAAAAATRRSAATAAARLGWVRGDLWADCALTYTDLFWRETRNPA